MIGNILENIVKELNDFIDESVEFRSGKKNVVLARPTNNKGEVSIPENCISMSVININEDTSMRSPMLKRRVEGDKVYTQKPGISLDLKLIFIANFPNDYANELNFITKVIEFFQKKDTFTTANTPSLKKQERYMEKLVFKLSVVGLEDQHNIWNSLGIKYMPSVIFNVGKVLVQDDEILSTTRPVSTVDRKVVQK